jgi:hypothetical protein
MAGIILRFSPASIIASAWSARESEKQVRVGGVIPDESHASDLASILMTMRYVHPAGEQTTVEKFEKFSAEGIISAAALQQRRRVTTKVTITWESELMTTAG